MGSPGSISVKFYVDVNGWPRYLMPYKIAENYNRLSRVHKRYRQTDDRQTTDGQQHIANVNVVAKNLLNNNISPTCPYNMVNFGLLAAESVSLVWGNMMAALPIGGASVQRRKVWLTPTTRDPTF